MEVCLFDVQDRGPVGDFCLAAANAAAAGWDETMRVSYEEAARDAGVDFYRAHPLGKTEAGSGVVVEGNIGSGKTSLLDAVRELCGAVVIQENFNGPLFRAMCATHGGQDAVSPREVELAAELSAWKRFAFQLSMLNSRVYNTRKMLLESKSLRRPAQPVHVFLTTPAEVCFRNIETRGRPEERTLELEYLEKIESVHMRMAVMLAAHGHDVVVFEPCGSWTQWEGVGTKSSQFALRLAEYAKTGDRSMLPLALRVSWVHTGVRRKEMEIIYANAADSDAFNKRHGIDPDSDVVLLWEDNGLPEFSLEQLGRPLSAEEAAALRLAFATRARLVLVGVVA